MLRSHTFRRAVASLVPRSITAVAAPPARAQSTLLKTSPEHPALKEFSVVYTDRALNHMSDEFGAVMKRLHRTLRETYNADHVVCIPGSGSYAMEACARQFAAGRKAMVLKNGYFSHRWLAVFEGTGEGATAHNTSDSFVPPKHWLPNHVCVLQGRPDTGDWDTGGLMPAPIDEVVAAIRAEKPAVIFAPHVETSTGVILPDDYVRQVGAAAREVGAAFVLDGIASGTAWIDMQDLNVDAFISAPQKGWTGPACVGLVMLSSRGREIADERGAENIKMDTPVTSFAVNLSSWLKVADTYESGSHMYYCTMPTDAIRTFEEVAQETVQFGLERADANIRKLGKGVRDACEARGLRVVAAEDYAGPGVIVAHAPNNDKNYFCEFADKGTQIAGGVPYMLGEPGQGVNPTFRFGLFGLDKIEDVDKTVAEVEAALDAVGITVKN